MLYEHHDRTFTEFWEGDLDLQAGSDGYDCDTTHQPTVDALEDFPDSKRTRGGLFESSIGTLQYRFTIRPIIHQPARYEGPRAEYRRIREHRLALSASGDNR